MSTIARRRSLPVDEGLMAIREELEAQTVAQLRKLAREAGVSGVAGLRKAELVDELLRLESEPKEARAPIEPRAAPAGAVSLPRRPVAGALLQIVGLIGILLSLAFALVVPVGAVLAGRAAQGYLAGAAKGARELGATVGLARSSLDAAALALEDSAGALRTVEGGLANADPLLGSVGDLLGDELPTTIESTRSALVNAQEGAAAMDRVLRALRLLGVDYDPEQPLDESLAETADSLAPLPASLEAVERDLDTSRRDLSEVTDELGKVREDLLILSGEIGEVGDSLVGYSGELIRAGEALEQAAQAAPRVGWIAGGLLALFALTSLAGQYSAIMVGRILRDPSGESGKIPPE